MSLKIIFAGTPEFAAIHLKALIDSEHEVVAVYTSPARAACHGKKLQSRPVKQVAIDNNIPVCQPLSFKEQSSIAELKCVLAVIIVVVAYGLLLPLAVS